MLKKKLKELFKLFLITIFFFILVDLVFGNYVYKKILRKNYFDLDFGMGMQHPIYHHGLKKNYTTHSSGWGKRKFSFCTDNYGFRNSCGYKNKSKYFDIGIIGDSQTAGFGLTYDEMFSTIISKKLKNKKIANLSSPSYAPSIYFSKINYLLKNGYKFNEIIVFVDVSDFFDDFVRYDFDGEKVLTKNQNWSDENYSYSEKFMFFMGRNLKVTNYLILNFNDFLIQKKIKQKKIPHWVMKNPRSMWTYDYKRKWYLNEDLDVVIDNSVKNMEKLYNLLNKNNISLSVAVFPWPSTLKFDGENNLQVKIWKNFCLSRCKTFFNIMQPFFKIKDEIGFRQLYFKYFIDGDIHLNENGNRIIAETFLENYNN